MNDRAVIVEGPDDVAVVRALLRGIGATSDRETTRPGGAPSSLGASADARRGFFATLGEVRLRVLAAEGKSRLAKRSLEVSTADFRPKRIAICFDPDGDDEKTELEFFLHDVRKISGVTVQGGGTSLQLVRKRESYEIVPAPWRSSSEAHFDGLGDERCLERVLISGILAAGVESGASEIIAAVEQATKQLASLRPSMGWKRAFRIFGAAIKPEAEMFAAGLLQDETFGKFAYAAVRDSEAGRAIKDLLVP